MSPHGLNDVLHSDNQSEYNNSYRCHTLITRCSSSLPKNPETLPTDQTHELSAALSSLFLILHHIWIRSTLCLLRETSVWFSEKLADRVFQEKPSPKAFKKKKKRKEKRLGIAQKQSRRTPKHHTASQSN